MSASFIRARLPSPIGTRRPSRSGTRGESSRRRIGPRPHQRCTAALLAGATTVLAACLALAFLGDVPTATAADPAARAPERFSTDARFIRDGQGRAVLLRGVNLSHTAKRSPGGVPWTRREDVRRIRTQLGGNVLRLTVFWEYVEPRRGEFDAGYLAALRRILDDAASADIVVILDMHQDLFGLRASDAREGDGPPAWARAPDCPPFEDLAPWSRNYFARAVPCQFERFWRNENDRQGDFRRAWLAVLRALGDHPAVIGLDPWNEPFVPAGRRAEDVLVPFYRELLPALHEAAPRLLLFVEPSLATSSGGDEALPPLGLPGVVQAPHFYPESVSVDLMAPYPYRGDHAELERLLDRHLTRTREAGAPLWIGEMGIADTAEGSVAMMRDFLALADRHLLGFARWSWDAVQDYPLGMVDRDRPARLLPSVAATARPFPERTSGTPTRLDDDPTTGRTSLEIGPSIAGETVFSCPPLACAAGVTVMVGVGDAEPRRVAAVHDRDLGQVRVAVPTAERVRVVLSSSAQGSADRARSDR